MLCLATNIALSLYVSKRCVTQSCPPDDQSSRQADFPILLHTHREAQRSVCNRNTRKSMISIVRAWARQTINRRGKPNMRSSYTPVEGRSVLSPTRIIRNSSFPLCGLDHPSRSIVEASRIRDPLTDPPRGQPLRPQSKPRQINHDHCAGMVPPIN